METRKNIKEEIIPASLILSLKSKYLVNLFTNNLNTKKQRAKQIMFKIKNKIIFIFHTSLVKKHSDKLLIDIIVQFSQIFYKLF